MNSLPSLFLRPAPSAGVKRPLAALVGAADTERESVRTWVGKVNFIRAFF